MKRYEKTPYLTEQIIPYIGNKRRLLPLIEGAVRLVLEDKSEDFGRKRFLDLFAGSGIVSRLAKHLGFEVHANDWEYYSYVLTYAFLCINEKELGGMYSRLDGLKKAISYLNNLPQPDQEDEYIARYFCPRDDSSPDYKTERLFYTRYNGLMIDKIRNEIESIYPEEEVASNHTLFREKVLLLALLLYQAATHTNTSGVFKAFHKGFGGHSGDALGRIMKPISVVYPSLIDSNCRMDVYKEDANQLLKRDFFSENRFDIVYVDPPYNQHQYGSNYHLLNTIALWDGIPLNKIISIDGEKKNRAGIRKDWVNTKSDYCYSEKADSVFEDLIEHVNSRFILISYSTEGTIPFEMMIQVCARKGKISLLTNEYVKYRGGRQSLRRLNNNIEFVIIIDTERRSVKKDIERIDDVITHRKLLLQLKRGYCKSRLKNHFKINEESGCIGYSFNGSAIWLKTRGFYRIDGERVGKEIDGYDLNKKQKMELKRELIERLLLCECKDKTEEIDEVIRIIDEQGEDAVYFNSLLPDLLKKICHKKYQELFFQYLEKIRTLQERFPSIYRKIETKIDALEELGMKRFYG
ncbi:MAG: DNA adenine methylase [Spirochaetota bacterium]|nr:MAG: DNA adenine methylase [Spirochaetota bacterium]